jgi:hypothetical protein
MAAPTLLIRQPHKSLPYRIRVNTVNEAEKIFITIAEICFIPALKKVNNLVVSNTYEQILLNKSRISDSQMKTYNYKVIPYYLNQNSVLSLLKT